jgi:hypothetical protein
MKYLKAVAAVIVSALGAVVVALGTTSTGDAGDIGGKTWLVGLLAVLGSGGLVFLVENVPAVAAGVAKAGMAFLTAGVGSLVVALDDDVISQAEWLTAASAAFVATGLVYQAKNASP